MAWRGRRPEIVQRHKPPRQLNYPQYCSPKRDLVRVEFVFPIIPSLSREALPSTSTGLYGQGATALGWHIVIYFEAVDLPGLWQFFSAVPNNIGATIVVDRMGRLEVNQPVDGPEFERFRRFMHDHARFYIKVSCPECFSISGQRALLNEHTANTSVLPHLNVIPFARRIVRTFSDRPLLGTDWPHPNLLGQR